jgi:hypothetical protein
MTNIFLWLILAHKIIIDYSVVFLGRNSTGAFNSTFLGKILIRQWPPWLKGKPELICPAALNLNKRGG